MQSLQINFDTHKQFEISNIKPLNGIVGLYFIFNENTFIQYPFQTSRLLYIGMSEKKNKQHWKQAYRAFRR